MKILQVHSADQGGGAELIALNLHKDFEKAGHDSILLVGRKLTNSPNVFQIPQVQRYPGEFRLSKWLSSRFGLQNVYGPGSYSLKQQIPWLPDVVLLHSLHGASGFFDLGALPALCSSQPTFQALHDQWMITGHCAYALTCEKWRSGCGKCPDLSRYPAVRKDGTNLNWRRKRWIYKKSNLKLIPTAKWLEYCVQQSPLLKDKSTNVIYNSVDTSIFTPGSKTAARIALNLPIDKPLILYLANHGTKAPFKDFGTLSKALGLVKEWGIEYNLVAAGGQASQVASEGVPDSTIFMPYTTDRQAIANLYRAADLFCHATIADVCPLTILEAQACGTAVIASNAGGIPEILEDGKSGVLVDVGDATGFANAIRELLNDHEKRKDMGAYAANFVKTRFTPEIQVREYEKLFKSALNVNEIAP